MERITKRPKQKSRASNVYEVLHLLNKHIQAGAHDLDKVEEVLRRETAPSAQFRLVCESINRAVAYITYPGGRKIRIFMDDFSVRLQKYLK